MRKDLTRFASVCGLILAAALPAMPGAAHDVPPDPGQPSASPATSARASGGPFTLVDHTGREVSDQNYRGTFMLVFFGYTFCPDICPMTLSEITLALEYLSPTEKAAITPLFITVDPERDTPEVLSEYLQAFDPAIVGLSGTPDQVHQFADAYNVTYEKAVDPTGANGDYSVDHNSYIYLMGPAGEFWTVFGFDSAPERLGQLIRRELVRGYPPWQRAP